MWATEWGTSPGRRPGEQESTSRLDVGSVALAKSLVWGEHCIECAIPDCYSVCPLYVRRRDAKCARFEYGIYANPRFPGLFEFGADVHFRRWGRLEATLGTGAASPGRLRSLARLDRAALSVVNAIAGPLERFDPRRRLNGAYRIAVGYGISQATRRTGRGRERFDDLVVEVTNPNSSSVGLIVEVQQDRPVFRTSLALQPGENLHRIPFAEIERALDGRDGRILVYPENDAEVRLIFRWLDVVRYARAARNVRTPGSNAAAGSATVAEESPRPLAGGAQDQAIEPVRPAPKVKCVAWDLDNTVWSGVLIEDGPSALTLRPGVSELISRLDERGILNTVVSKNDHDAAWAKLTELGLSQFFVAPAINWGAKSASLRAVAEALNIGLDTFLLIDDSAFERAEVTAQLPQVRAVPETDIATLIDRPEFDVPVTAESRQRRLSYQAEEIRQSVAASMGGDYEAFLRSCEIKATLFHPMSQAEQDRVFELLLRSNQLNLSTRRYSREELVSLLNDESVLSLGLRSRDRFGDYGIVGFLSIEMGGVMPSIRDLVISCRVAKKKVENAVFQWLALQLGDRGADGLEAGYVATARNHVLLDVLTEVGFVPVDERDGVRILRLTSVGKVPGGSIVDVDASGVTIPEITHPPSPGVATSSS